MAAKLVLLSLVPLVHSYCFGAGYNPWFTGPPLVQQLTLTSVRVSWHGLLQQAGCADNLLVKHYRGIDSSNYKMSEPLLASVTSYVVHDLVPNAQYTYQVIAREEKGILGVDYNRGEKTTFTTSLHNRERGLEVEQDDPILVTQTTKETDDRDDETPVVTQAAVAPVYSDSQKSRSVVAGLPVEVLVGVIIGLMVVCIVTVGVVYNCVKKKGPEKDLELDSDMYEGDSDDEDDEDDEDGDEEEEDEFNDTSKETKKYDMMAEQSKQLDNNPKQLLRPMSVA